MKLLSAIFAGKERYCVGFLVILGIIMYAMTMKGIYGNPAGLSIKNNLDQATKPFELSPERDRYLLTLSLDEHKSFSLSKELAEVAYPDVGYHDGKFYIFFAPGISLFAYPLYTLGKMFNLAQVGAFSLSTLFACASLVFLFKIARNMFKLPLWASLLSPIIFAFASTSWSYAVTMYQHHATAFFILSGFYAVWKYSRQKGYSWMWGVGVWLNYALALLIDYPNGFLMLPVMLYFFLSAWKLYKTDSTVTLSFRASFLLTSVLFVLVTGWHGYFNYTHFGSPLKLSGSITGYKDIKEKKLLEKKGGQEEIKKISEKKGPVSFFKEENVINGMNTLLFSSDRGLLFYSPIFFLAFLGILFSLGTISTEKAVLLSLIGANFFLYSSWGDPWGGYAYGPRYLIPSMAMLSLFIPVWIVKVKHTISAKIITVFLFVYSSAIALLGVLTTNAVPPKVEAVYFNVPYNYLLNIQYLVDNKSSSFLYNYVFKHTISLMDYYWILFGVILFIFLFILFILPGIDKHEN